MMIMPLQEAKDCFHNWWKAMQTMQATHGEPADGMEKFPEFVALAEAHDALLTALVNETGYDAFIFRKTVLMAMEEVLDDDDDTPTEQQVDEIMQLTLAFSAATHKRVEQMEGKQPN